MRSRWRRLSRRRVEYLCWHIGRQDQARIPVRTPLRLFEHCSSIIAEYAQDGATLASRCAKLVAGQGSRRKRRLLARHRSEEDEASIPVPRTETLQYSTQHRRIPAVSEGLPKR